MELNEQNILIFVGPDYEELELHYPKLRLIETGAKVTVAGPKAKESYKGKHSYPCQSDLDFDQVKVKDYQALILPGGYAPDVLRRIPKALEIIHDFNDAKKLIAFICHAGWLPISAKVIKNVKCTSAISIKDDMINAGANWVDEPVVIDRNFISSRYPPDLPKFCAAIIEYLRR